jgi:hypothetical protein
MTEVVHDMVIVTAAKWAFDINLDGDKGPPDVAQFMEDLPPEFQTLLSGPVSSVANGYFTWTFGPCGSKVGWLVEIEFREWADKFVDLFSFRFDDGSSPFEVIRVHYGRTSSGEYQVDTELKNPA